MTPIFEQGAQPSSDLEPAVRAGGSTLDEEENPFRFQFSPDNSSSELSSPSITGLDTLEPMPLDLLTPPLEESMLLNEPMPLDEPLPLDDPWTTPLPHDLQHAFEAMGLDDNLPEDV